MRHLPPALLLLILTSAASGQKVPEVSLTAMKVADEKTASDAAIDAPAPPRNASPGLTANINAALPKFSPRKNADSDKTKEPAPDLREIDKPRNTIIRLPKALVQEKSTPAIALGNESESAGDVIQLPNYVVRDRKVPDFKERELLTPSGKLADAYKRWPGLRFSLPFLSNNGIARAMIEDEYEHQRMAEIRDLYGLYDYSDPKAGASVKKETEKALMRTDSP